MDHGGFVSFVKDQRRRGLSETTIDRRRRVLRSLAAFIEPRDPLTVTHDEIQRWLDSLNLRSKRSRYMYLSTVASWCRFCVLEGLRVDDPTLHIQRPRLPRSRPRPVKDADLEMAIRIADPRMKAWLLLAAYEGFRCKEIATLQREDVLDDRDPPLLLVMEGKGDNQGVVPLHPDVEHALRVHGLPRTGHVFTMDDGRPYRPGTVSVYVSRYLHGLGIECSAHQLRHWFGTAVWSATKDLRVTQELLRHADPKTTAIYSQYDNELATKAVRSLGVKPQQGHLL